MPSYMAEAHDLLRLGKNKKNWKHFPTWDFNHQK